MPIAAFQYYTSTGSVREDLIPDITNISPDDTPFTSRIGKTKATQRTHEYLTDALEARTASTPVIEGITFASTTRAARTRLTNFCEILLKAFTISGSVESMDTVSNGKTEFRYQSGLRMKELANGIEHRFLFTATGTAGASATAPQMKSVIPLITTNWSSATASRTLTLALMNGALQSAWTQGGKPDVIMVGGGRKVNLVNVQSSAYGTRWMGSQGGKIEQRVEVYIGEFGGNQEVVLSRDMDNNFSETIAIFEMSRWKLAWLRRPHLQTMGKEGDRRSAQWVAEYTGEARQEAASARVSNISG